MSIETREKNFFDKKIFFPEAQNKYNEFHEDQKNKKIILLFLKKSEKERRLGCWRRNWENIIHRRSIEERKPGKELENVLGEVFNQFLGKDFEIFLASYEDDKEGKDLIIYHKEKDLLFSVDLTMNKNHEILEDKYAFFHHDNPSSLKVPPPQREFNPRTIRLVLYLPLDVGFEIMVRFYEKIKNKELEKIKDDPVFIAVFSEFLDQIKLELQKISQFSSSSIKFDDKDRKDCQNLLEIISSQKEELNKKLTPETEGIKNYLNKEREKIVKLLGNK